MATNPIQQPNEQAVNAAVVTEKAAMAAKVAFLRDTQRGIASKMGQVENDLDLARARVLAKQQDEKDAKKDVAEGSSSGACAPAVQSAATVSLAKFEFVDSGSQDRLYFDPLSCQFATRPDEADMILVGSCLDEDDDLGAGCCIDDCDDGGEESDLYQRQLAQIAEAMNSGYGDVHGKQQELAALQALHRLAVSETDAAEQQMDNFVHQNQNQSDGNAGEQNGMNLLSQTGVLASA